MPEPSAGKAVEGLCFVFGEAAAKVAIAELKTNMADLKTGLKSGIATVNNETTGLKIDTSKLKSEMLRWNLIIAGAVIAILGLLSKL